MIVHAKSPTAALPRTVADLLERLGDVDPKRIRLQPPPGHVTDEDVAESKDRFGCLCELVDGVLVEKVMGAPEALLATELAHLIKIFLDDQPLGVIYGADGAIRIFAHTTRLPDISFVSWDEIPGDNPPLDSIVEVVPDLVVEVISPGNRPGEMQVKLREYFEVGVKLVWYIYPKTKTARVYKSLKAATEIKLPDFLDGGDVLPGFRLKLQTLFERAFPKRPKKKRGK